MSKSIPEGWLDYRSYGDVINGTKFLAFKVPLKETVVNNLQPEKRFTTAILMKSQPKIKYIVDLTNTTKYYNQADFTSAGIKYQKIMIPGTQVPPLECVKRFFKVIEKFSKECGPDEIIGIHCTHGVNRTGYLICRYLVQQLGWKHQSALKGFSEARGYPIERVAYVNDLRRVPIGSKLDVSKVKLDVPLRLGEKQKLLTKHLIPRPPFPPMGPPSPMSSRRAFMNDVPFPPPPPGKFGPPRPPNFGPPRPPPPIIGPPPPPRGPIIYGLPRPPRGPFGPLPAPPPMRHGPPLPPLHGPSGLRIPGPPRLPPVMGPPGPPPRLSGMSLRAVHRPGPPMPPPGAPMRMTPKKMSSLKRAKDQDFTADVFEENLAAQPAKKYLKN